MFRSLKTFIKDPLPSGDFQSLAPGLNIVEGIVRVETPLRSPVRGQNCVAFFYRSFLSIGGGRNPMPTIHKLKQAEVYTPFELEMDGGILAVAPAKKGNFGHQDHLALSRQYGKEFQGIEEVILPGARVRLRGKARKVDGKFQFIMKSIIVIEKQVVSAGMVGNRKKRKRN